MLGFTKNEQRVLWFLTAGFFIGLGVWVYRAQIQPLPEQILGRPERHDISGEPDSLIQLFNPKKDFKTGSKQLFRINMNTASRDTLTLIPGIGPVTAERIVQYRKMHGLFQAEENLMKVKGIGPKTFEKIKPYIYIDPMKEER